MLLLTVGATAQKVDYIDKIESIAARSLAIEAYRSQFTADSLSLRRGLNPDDPEVSGDYFFDNNFELTVEQKFDFPTVYANRAKLSKLGIERAGVGFRSAHLELMSQISEQYVMLIYYNRLSSVLLDRSTSLKKYLEQMNLMLEKGEVTKIEFNAAQTLSRQMQSELTLALSEQKKCITMLAQWGYTLPVEKNYPQFRPISRDEFVNMAMSSNFELQASKIDSMIAHRTLKLSRSEWIPKFKVGYRMEIESGTLRNAVVAGISIPLWQNRGNIKQSKAMIESSKKSDAAIQARVKATLENLFTNYESLDIASKEYPDNTQEYIDMLRKSLDEGMINETEYLLSIIERYSVEQRKLELEMESIQTRAMMEMLTKNG